MAKIRLGPLDAEGVRFDRPPSQVKWTELTNVVLHEGRIITRPGFRVFNSAGALDYPSVRPLPVVSIAEIFNPGDTATGRESYTPATENLTPDGHTDPVAGWTGSHTDVDEGTPDNSVTIISSTTEGAQIALTFTNPANTYSTILGVLFHVRARINNTGAFVKLNFYQRVSSTNYLIDSKAITVREDTESDDWQDVFFTLTRDLSTPVDNPLTASDLNNLTLVIEHDSSESFQADILEASGNGTHQEWTDATNGGTATFTDIDGKPFIVVFDDSTLPDNNFMQTSTAGARQSFTFTPNLTFASIIYVSPVTYARKPNALSGAADLSLVYYDSGGTEYTLLNDAIPPGKAGEIFRDSITLNPADNAAWEAADITGGEFGIKFNSGPPANIGTFGLTIFGTETGGATVEITTVNAQVLGVSSSNPGLGITDKTRLFSSNVAHFRQDSDIPLNPTITDVTNSVPLDSTGPGWPVDHAVLYGQVYKVNGVDPTVRYPTSSNVYEELATNDSSGSNPITGRCVASFAGRIFYGWVKDNTTVTPERIAYSQLQDGGTHNDTSAGTFDLLDTPGGVVALVPLDERLMAGLKQEGCYVIRHTGLSRAPFIRDVIDFETGCLATRTAQRIQAPDGTAGVAFLGQNKTDGVNVFIFDGTTVRAIGTPIAKKLRDDMNPHTALLTAHAHVDPRTNTYWLFIPEGIETFPKQAWVMNIGTQQWTRAEFPFEVYSSDNWHLPIDTDITTASTELLGGQQLLTIGTGSTTFPLSGLSEIGYDELTHPSPDLGSISALREDFTEGGRLRQVFTQTMATGDLVKPEEFETVSYRLNIVYTAKNAATRVLVSASEDGGKNWNTEREEWLTPELGNEPYQTTGGTYYASLDLTPSAAEQVRYRIRVQSEPITVDGTTDLSIQSNVPAQLIELHDLWLEVESGAQDA